MDLTVDTVQAAAEPLTAASSHRRPPLRSASCTQEPRHRAPQRRALPSRRRRGPRLQAGDLEQPRHLPPHLRDWAAALPPSSATPATEAPRLVSVRGTPTAPPCTSVPSDGRALPHSAAVAIRPSMLTTSGYRGVADRVDVPHGLQWRRLRAAPAASSQGLRRRPRPPGHRAAEPRRRCIGTARRRHLPRWWLALGASSALTSVQRHPWPSAAGGGHTCAARVDGGPSRGTGLAR